jgi:protein-S-isoprenylcysteine O-methyltransferase Ste14
MKIFIAVFIGTILSLYLIGFILKNIITVKQTKQSIKGKSVKVNLLIFTTSILYLITYTSLFLQNDYFINIRLLNVIYLKILGLILIAFAFFIGIPTLITMKNSWRVGIRPEQKTELVIDGFFRFCRNPYFLSYILMFLGIFLVFPTFIYLLFYIPFVVIIHFMILDEEKHLAQQHGKQYLDYKHRVKRYGIF